MSRVVERTKENLKKCKCMGCPSYTFKCKIEEIPKDMFKMMTKGIENVEHFEGMFCTFGKSECIQEKKGCHCNECAVKKENELEGGYFCQP